ncbi:MAG: insulinase family protein, partial [Alistipes sp.]|nr:insulinase family protein [Alistipes sp.]
FEAICSEMERLRRFGFTQSEFERAQENLLRSAERKYTNRNDRRNNEFVNTYLHNYQLNTPIPDAETEWKLDSMLIKQINVDAVNMYVQQTIYPRNQVIFITAPQREGVENPTEAEVLAIREKVMNSELTAYEDNTVKEPLIPENVVLAGSPVMKTSENEKYGTTEWVLENGVRIVVKPTTFKADEVQIMAYALNGLSGLTDKEYYMGELMPAINQMSGVGKFSAADLRKQLAGKSARVQASTSDYSNSIGGVGSPKDMETLLQLLYLNFTQPRFDENDYNTLMKMLRAQLENARTNPDFVMQEKFTDVAYGHNPRRQVITTEVLDEFSFDKLSGIYAKLFPGADSFTFYIVGNVDVNVLKPLVEKYIGSIPTTGSPVGTIDDKAAPVKGAVLEDFQTAMQQPKVSVHYRFTGDMPQSIRGKLAMTLLTEALNSRYLISIREEKGGTYGVHVYGSTQARPHETYRMDIQFDTNEEMADELREIVMQELRAIAENGPKSEDIEKTREFLAKQWKNSLEQNGSWIPYLLDYDLLGFDYLADYEATLRSMTGADVQALAKKMLDDNNLVQVVMRPAPVAEK